MLTLPLPFPRARQTVLVIDDEPTIRMLVEAALTRTLGVRVLQADRGAAGLALAETRRPDLILLDWVMPDLDGLTTLGLLKASPRTRGVPVVMATTVSRMGRIDEALMLGAADYVCKPLDITRLTRTVGDALQSKRTGRVASGRPARSAALGAAR